MVTAVRLTAWALCLAGGLAWLHCRRKRLASGRHAGGPASDAARDAGQAAADADAEGAEPLELRLRVRDWLGHLRYLREDREQIVRVRPDVEGGEGS